MKRLGEQLAQVGLIQEHQLTSALTTQAERGGRLGSILVEQGALPVEVLAAVLSRHYRAAVPPQSWLEQPDEELLNDVHLELVQAHRFIPMRSDPNFFHVATIDPQDQLLPTLTRDSAQQVKAYVLPELVMDEWLEWLFEFGPRRIPTGRPPAREEDPSLLVRPPAREEESDKAAPHESAEARQAPAPRLGTAQHMASPLTPASALLRPGAAHTLSAEWKPMASTSHGRTMHGGTAPPPDPPAPAPAMQGAAQPPALPLRVPARDGTQRPMARTQLGLPPASNGQPPAMPLRHTARRQGEYADASQPEQVAALGMMVPGRKAGYAAAADTAYAESGQHSVAWNGRAVELAPANSGPPTAVVSPPHDGPGDGDGEPLPKTRQIRRLPSDRPVARVRPRPSPPQGPLTQPASPRAKRVRDSTARTPALAPSSTSVEASSIANLVTRPVPPRAVPAELRTTTHRHELIDLTLRTATHFCRYVMAMAVHSNTLWATHICERGDKPSAPDRLRMPIPQGSFWERVISPEAQPLRVVVRPQSTTAYFLQRAQRSQVQEFLLLPVMRRGRVATLLYADNGADKLTDTAVTALVHLVAELSISYDRMVRRNQALGAL